MAYNVGPTNFECSESKEECEHSSHLMSLQNIMDSV